MHRMTEGFISTAAINININSIISTENSTWEADGHPDNKFRAANGPYLKELNDLQSLPCSRKSDTGPYPESNPDYAAQNQSFHKLSESKLGMNQSYIHKFILTQYEDHGQFYRSMVIIKLNVCVLFCPKYSNR